MTAERLRVLRQKKPDRDSPNFALMQQQFDAGLLECLGSGLPVFNPAAASQQLQLKHWHLLCDLAEALNAPSTEHTAAAISSCRALIAALKSKHAPESAA